MIVDLGIAACRQVEVDHPMRGHVAQHVIQKGDPAIAVPLPLAIQVESHGYVCFTRLATLAHCASARHHDPPTWLSPLLVAAKASIALAIVSFCSGVPTEMRTQRSRPPRP